MSDLTISTEQGVLFQFARQVSALKGRDFPFKVGYAFNRTEDKVNAELKRYHEARESRCQALATTNGDGKAKRLADGTYDLTDEAKAMLGEDMAPLLAEMITLTNIRLATVAELDGMALTATEQRGYAPFIAEDAPAK